MRILVTTTVSQSTRNLYTSRTRTSTRRRFAQLTGKTGVTFATNVNGELNFSSLAVTEIRLRGAQGAHKTGAHSFCLFGCGRQQQPARTIMVGHVNETTMVLVRQPAACLCLWTMPHVQNMCGGTSTQERTIHRDHTRLERRMPTATRPKPRSARFGLTTQLRRSTCRPRRNRPA